MNEIITGPGDYKCRDGSKATVGYFNTVNGYWVGNLESGGLNQWPNSGRTFGDSLASPHDIIAPWTEPKLRDWTLEEIPLGAQLRPIGGHAAGIILSKWRGQSSCVRIAYYNCTTMHILTVDQLRSGYSHSTDGGKTWKPCVVVE